MKNPNTKSILIFILELVLITTVGVLLYTFELNIFINLGVFIALLAEILWGLKCTYDNKNTNTKLIINASFSLAGIGYFIYYILKFFIYYPSVIVSAYMFLQGYLIMTGCINISKNSNKNSKIAIRIGVPLYAFTLLFAFLGLFGLVE